MYIMFIILTLFNYRLHESATVKGVDIKCLPIQDIDEELKSNSHDTFHKLSGSSKKNIPILGIKRDTGSTTWHDMNLKDDQLFAFGIPRWFFRINFTSAICNVPYVYICWIKFTMEFRSNTCYIGHMASNE